MTAPFFLPCAAGVEDLLTAEVQPLLPNAQVHTLRGGVHHQHSLGRCVKQDTVTGLNVTQTQIIALHRLLGFNQATLQFGQAFEIAAHGQQLACTQGQHHVLNGHLVADGREVVHMPPAQHIGRTLRVQHFLNFAATFAGDGVDPAATDPRLATQSGQVVAPG